MSEGDVVASMRRLLPDPLLRFELRDYVEGLIVQAVSGLGPVSFSVGSPQPTTETVITRVRALEELTFPIATALLVGCHYGDQPDHTQIWLDALESLADTARYQATATVYNAWERLRFYPALIALYSVGIGSLTARRPEAFAKILAKAQWDAETPLDREVGLSALGYVSAELVPESPMAASVWMSQQLAQLCQGTVPPRRVDTAFDETELVLGLVSADRSLREDFSGEVVAIPGRQWFSTDGARHRAGECVSGGRVGPWLEAGLFGGSADRLVEVKRRYDAAVSEARVQIQFGLRKWRTRRE
jgi:hypothetical protein